MESVFYDITLVAELFSIFPSCVDCVLQDVVFLERLKLCDGTLWGLNFICNSICSSCLCDTFAAYWQCYVSFANGSLQVQKCLNFRLSRKNQPTLGSLLFNFPICTSKKSHVNKVYCIGNMSLKYISSACSLRILVCFLGAKAGSPAGFCLCLHTQGTRNIYWKV